MRGEGRKLRCPIRNRGRPQKEERNEIKERKGDKNRERERERMIVRKKKGKALERRRTSGRRRKKRVGGQTTERRRELHSSSRMCNIFTCYSSMQLPTNTIVLFFAY